MTKRHRFSEGILVILYVGQAWNYIERSGADQSFHVENKCGLLIWQINGPNLMGHIWNTDKKEGYFGNLAKREGIGWLGCHVAHYDWPLCRWPRGSTRHVPCGSAERVHGHDKGPTSCIRIWGVTSSNQQTCGRVVSGISGSGWFFGSDYQVELSSNDTWCNGILPRSPTMGCHVAVGPTRSLGLPNGSPGCWV